MSSDVQVLASDINIGYEEIINTQVNKVVQLSGAKWEPSGSQVGAKWGPSGPQQLHHSACSCADPEVSWLLWVTLGLGAPCLHIPCSL